MALIAALFMIIVVAALGVFATRLGSDQQQGANLALLTHRTVAAANSALEFMSYRVSSGVNCAAIPPAIQITTVNVTLSCVSTANHFVDAGAPRQVYDLTAIATHGVYGSPDFVKRTLTRRVGNVGTTPAW